MKCCKSICPSPGGRLYWLAMPLMDCCSTVTLAAWCCRWTVYSFQSKTRRKLAQASEGQRWLCSTGGSSDVGDL